MELWSSSQASWTRLCGLQLSQLQTLLHQAGKAGGSRHRRRAGLGDWQDMGRYKGTTSPLPDSRELAEDMFSGFPLTPESVGCKKAVFPQSCQAGEGERRAAGRGTGERN